MERVTWWITLTLFLVAVLLGLFSLAATVALNPEITAFVLGLLGFWLFANRLIFGFGQIANLASYFIEGKELKKEEIACKVVRKPEEAKLRGLEEQSVVTLLTMWRSSLEPFKYAYYFGFFILFLFALLFELNVISSLVFGPIVKALTLGATIPTVFTWGLELLSEYYLSKALTKAIKS